MTAGSLPVGVPDGGVATGVDLVSAGLYSDPNIQTTLTADPTTGTSLAVTLRDLFPQTITSDGFFIAVNNEIMKVTGGAGTGAGNFTVTRGVKGSTAATSHAIGSVVRLLSVVQRVSPVVERYTTFRGRSYSFRIPGIAGTAGQKLVALHNASGSDVIVEVKKITVDLLQTVVKAITVAPPIIRTHRFTVVPTNGSAASKTNEDSAQTSSANVTAWQGASADGTASATPLTITIPAGNLVAQEFAPRFITAAGYEMFDRTTFLEEADDYITLRALEGVCIFLDYTLATQNPVTDMWVCGIRWEEYRV